MQTVPVSGQPAADAAQTMALWPAVLLPSVAQANAGALATLSPVATAGMAGEALRQGVGPLLYGNLQDMPLVRAAAIPEMARLHTAYRQSALLALQRSSELCRILDALAASGIRPAVFKGAALAYTLYPAPACRPMGDIDLWVTSDEMPVAVAALAAQGYIFYEKQRRPHALTQTTDGEVQMRPGRPGQGLVELHWGVFPGEWLAHTAVIDRTGVRSRLVPASLLNRDVLLLAPEDALLQLAVHIGINHQMTVNVLRSLVDVALVAERGVDWAVVIQRARSWRVATVIGLVLNLTHQLFGVSALAAPAAALAPGPVQARLLRRFITAQTILTGADLSAHRSRFAYLLFVADRPVDSVRLLARAIWPEANWLAARYQRTDWVTRLRHAAAALHGKI